MTASLKLDTTFLDKNKKYIFALSGGQDSMVLLDVLIKNYLAPENIIVVHVNHNIRKSSSSESEFIKTECKKRKLKLEIEQIPASTWENKLSNIEERARVLRYKILNKKLEEYSAQYIITAHHFDDHLETIYLNYIRGCGLAGLKGMSILNQKILRPLLKISKADIKKYQIQNKIPFIEDESNNDKRFLRNKIRIDTLQKLTSEDRLALDNLSKASHKLYVNTILESCSLKFVFHNKHIEIPKSEFTKLKPETQKLVIHFLTSGSKLCRSKVVTNIYDSIKTNKSGQKFISPNTTVYIGPEKIYILDSNYFQSLTTPQETIKFKKLNQEMNFTWHQKKWKLSPSINRTKIILPHPSDPISISSIQAGDKIISNGKIVGINRYCKKHKIDLLSRSETFVIKQHNIVIAVPQLNLFTKASFNPEIHCYLETALVN